MRYPVCLPVFNAPAHPDAGDMCIIRPPVAVGGAGTSGRSRVPLWLQYKLNSPASLQVIAIDDALPDALRNGGFSRVGHIRYKSNTLHKAEKADGLFADRILIQVVLFD